MKATILRYLLIFILLLLSSQPLSASGGQADTPPSTAPQKLIEVLGCMGCHTIGSKPGSSIASDLTQIGSRMTPKQIEAYLIEDATTRTHGFMPSFRTLPTENLHQIATYLYHLK